MIAGVLLATGLGGDPCGCLPILRQTDGLAERSGWRQVVPAQEQGDCCADQETVLDGIGIVYAIVVGLMEFVWPTTGAPP